MEEIKLIIGHRSGKPFFETVPAERIAENTYRVLATPGLAPGVAAGDIIVRDATDPLGFRVIERSGNVALQVFFENDPRFDESQVTTIITAIGGWLDGGIGNDGGHLRIFTVPIGIGFNAIEKAMQQISSLPTFNRWYCGNVYDVRDGKTPLNWWDQVPGGFDTGRRNGGFMG
ncbi:MAG TPA: DUF4265 domain-containing protein [Tepidisphaeraceae bacterium]|jgi:hypothetical protein|nr:DUF4265 domain-containing protein [Tepidisphaeraceae bacterium]